MEKVRKFAHNSEAQLAKALLASHGIESQILGGTILVPAEDVNHARKIIEKVMASDMLLGGGAEPVNYLRKALLSALAAPFLLPVVFNAYSLYYGWKYWQSSPKESRDRWMIALILLLQIPTFFVVKYMFSMLGDLGSMMTIPDEGVDL